MVDAERDECTTPEQAFEQHFAMVWRSLRRLGVAPHALDDAAQDVFLVLHRRWLDYDPASPLRPWLFGIAFRVASAHRKRAAREVPHAFIEVEDIGPHPDQAADAKRARVLVLRALEQVPLPRRAVFVMHDLDDADMRDIASSLSIPLFTAYSRLRKARKEFEAAVRRQGHQRHQGRHR